MQVYDTRVQAAQDANARLDAAIEQVRVYSSHFLEAIDFSAVQAQLPDKRTALITFCLTEQGSMGFVVSQHDQEIQVVEMLTFTQTDLRHLFVEWDADGRPAGGWLGAYFRYLAEHTVDVFEAWQATITRVLAELGERLLNPVLSTLPASIERIILLPSAELFLFPLHAVPCSGNDSELMCDRYQVSYAPSIEVLADARAKVMQRVIPKLYAVINPETDPNLVFTPAEGTAIARLFAQHTVDAGQVGTKQRVLAGVQGQTYVHFACHGSYDWIDPPDSGLDLADNRLSLADLQHGDADFSVARLVTLSACETGITDVLQGSSEEYVGIPAGFLVAGVPCVVSSLWAVEDFSTSLLMEAFYQQHLVQGQNIAVALHSAQLWLRNLTRDEVVARVKESYEMIKNKDKAGKQLLATDQLLLARLQALEQELLEDYGPDERPFAHPYYWAAFLALGAV